MLPSEAEEGGARKRLHGRGLQRFAAREIELRLVRLGVRLEVKSDAGERHFVARLPVMQREQLAWIEAWMLRIGVVDAVPEGMLLQPAIPSIYVMQRHGHEGRAGGYHAQNDGGGPLRAQRSDRPLSKF